VGINFPYTQNSEEFVETPAKATGNDVFHPFPSINDWYETVKLNYGVDYENNRHQHFDPIPDTWNKMLGILEFWAHKGVDAFRVDMAEMVPVEFWKWVIGRMKEQFDNLVFIAEVYNPSLYQRFLYEGGFDFLYDKEQFYNYTRDIVTERASAKLLTQCWQQQEGVGKHLLRFLENHDEQRVASPQFCGNPWNAIPAMIVAATMHQGPLMVYFGQEIGEAALDHEGFSGLDGRTSIFDYWRIQEYQKWVENGNFDQKNLSLEQRNLRNFYVTLLTFRNKYRAVLEGAFFDLMYANQHNLNADKVYLFLRHNGSQILLIVVNFDLHSKQSFHIHFPEHALEVVGINLQSTVNMEELLWAEKSTKIAAIDLIGNGFRVEMQPRSGSIYEIVVV
jgi:glycosidase